VSLVKCLDCGAEISDKAVACVRCGRPLGNAEQHPVKSSTLWSTVTKARTPINVFALAMMACAAVLGYSATQVTGCDARTVFTYAIHAFLAVSGMFFLAILFCRKGIYHPEDLGNVKPEVLKELGKDRPVVAAALIMFLLLAYGFYQYRTPTPCEPGSSQQRENIHVTPGFRVAN